MIDSALAEKNGQATVLCKQANEALAEVKVSSERVQNLLDNLQAINVD